MMAKQQIILPLEFTASAVSPAAPNTAEAVNSNKYCHALITCFCLIAMMGCSRKSVEVVAEPAAEPETEELVLAQVNDVRMTETTFRQYWEKKQPEADNAETRRAMLTEMVDRQILVERARALGLDDDPTVRETFESAMIARLKEIELQPRIADVAVTEAELRAAYDARAATEFTTGPQVHVAVLWFNTRGQQALVDRYQPRLEAMLDEINGIAAGDGFGKLAVSNTEHRASRYKGGIIDWLEVDETYSDAWRQTVLDIAAPLQAPGALSAISATDQGLFLVRLVERRESSQRPFQHVSAMLRDRLVQERRQAAIAEFHNHNQVSVERFDDRLTELEPLAVAPKQPAPTGMFALEVQK